MEQLSGCSFLFSGQLFYNLLTRTIIDLQYEFFGFTRKNFPNDKIKKEQLIRLEEVLRHAILDGAISDIEIRYINNIFDESDLRIDEFNKLKFQLFSKIVSDGVQLGRIKPDDLTALEKIAEKLGIPARWQKQAEEQNTGEQ